MPKPTNRGSAGIDDWARTVKETLSQLGGGSKPKPKPLIKPKSTVNYASPGSASRTRKISRVDLTNRQRLKGITPKKRAR